MSKGWRGQQPGLHFLFFVPLVTNRGYLSALTASPKENPSGHLVGWATPWSAEEKLDGQRQRVDLSAHARTAHRDLSRKELEGDLFWIGPRVLPTTHRSRDGPRGVLNPASFSYKLSTRPPCFIVPTEDLSLTAAFKYM